MNNFTDLREVAENKWQAKYHGNYGVYNVKLTFNANGDRANFSCSCPSDGNPCKHIAMLEKEIEKHQKQTSGIKKAVALTVEEVLKHISFEELQKFVAEQTKYNPKLTNALMLEFSSRARTKNENPYFEILRKALKNVRFDYEDFYYSEDRFEIEPLDEWLEKAKNCLKHEKYEEALLISQASIEEYADWCSNVDNEICDYIETDYYESVFFDILHKIVEKTTEFNKKLYDYCKQEMQKSKYQNFDCFNDLLAKLATKTDPTEFIELQDSMLKKISDKSSFEAKKIFDRKIQFYRSVGQTEKADEIIENNLQIEDFCRQAVEKRISNQQYNDAKKLINNYLKRDPSYSRYWDERLLDIAQKEKDVPTIRKITFKLIDSHFNKKYYEIYRSTFSAEEWATELEKLIQHYGGKLNNKLSFSASIADVLVAEKADERLMTYLEKYNDVQIIDRYYAAVSVSFSERTLSLFRKTIDIFAEKNLGRDKYEYISGLLKKMQNIKGGKTVVNEMVTNYRTIYKNRPAMMEILRALL